MKSQVQHLLIRAPNWVGDLVMATPIMEAALADPRFGRVTVVLREHLAPVLAHGPLEEHILPLVGGGDEVAQLKTVGADAALLLSNSFGAAWRAWRAGIPLRAGASLSGRGLLLTHRFAPSRVGGRRVTPTAHLFRDVAGLLGVVVPSLQPRLHYAAAIAQEVRAELRERGLADSESYVLASPGAAFGSAKLWPPASFAAALDELHERCGLRGIVTGGPGEEPLMQAVSAAAASPVIDLSDAPRDLERLKPLVDGAALLLVGDSGPRWYAAAFGVPCVTIMGPNDPALTATSLERCTVVRLEDLECSPCMQRTCPLGHNQCTRDLPAGRAVQAALDLLERCAPAS